MKFDDLISQYALNDGEIVAFNFDFRINSAQLNLRVRKKLSSKKWAPCNLLIDFSGVTQISLFEDFSAGGNYSDITISQFADQMIYVSLDPYSNDGEPLPEDNWIIVAQSMKWSEIS